MACYFGCDSDRNKAAWVAFSLLLVTGAALVVGGVVKVTSCARLHQCNRFADANSELVCRQQRQGCVRPGAIIFAIGCLCLVAASLPLCFFCCCSEQPAWYKQNNQQVWLRLYAVSAMSHVAYSPSPPACRFQRHRTGALLILLPRALFAVCDPACSSLWSNIAPATASGSTRYAREYNHGPSGGLCIPKSCNCTSSVGANALIRWTHAKNDRSMTRQDLSSLCKQHAPMYIQNPGMQGAFAPVCHGSPSWG